MADITFTGPVLIEEDGDTRTLTAEDIRGAQGPQGDIGSQGPQGIQGLTGLTGPQGIPGEALVMADGGDALSITYDAGLDGGGAVWP